MRNLSATLLATVLASGCSLLYGTDDLLGTDAGGQTDAGHVDAGSMDSGSMDSGSIDAGSTDAGHDAGCVEMCGEVCTDTDHDPLHCGSCGNACPAPPDNAAATCSEGSCGFTCNPGFDLVVGSCAARPAPRPIAPLSTATATSKRPTFRWELAPRNDGARVEICADRACTTVITTIDATGDHARPTADLPTGVVFWRLYGRLGDDVGPEYSPTWQLYIRARSAPVDTSWGTVLDVNGDGFADAVHAVPPEGAAYVYLGNATALWETPAVMLSGLADSNGGFGSTWGSAGDVNGDGYADLFVGIPNADSNAGHVVFYFGGPAGPSEPESVQLIGPPSAHFGRAVAGAGDINGDGYADVVVGLSSTSEVHIYYGRPAGISTSPAILRSPASSDRFGAAVVSAGDVNGDGYVDLLVGAPDAEEGRGASYIYRGTESGAESSPGYTLLGPTEWFDPSLGNDFGTALFGGDVNGDGYSDVLVGARAYRSGFGGAFLYLGSSLGTSDTPVEIESSDGGMFGYALADVGDVNGDGYADAVIGAPGLGLHGHVVQYLGLPSGLEPSVLDIVGNGAPGFARRLIGPGDMNGDGFADLLIVADNVTLVHLGSTAGLRATSAAVLSSP